MPFRLPAALVAAGLALAALTAGAAAQSAADPNDQPTAGTLPSGTDTVRGGDDLGARPTGDVAPPRAIRPSTSVKSGGGRTDPLDHLSPAFRTSNENRER